MNTPPRDNDAPLTPELVPTPRNHRNLFPVPPDTPYIPRSHQRTSRRPTIRNDTRIHKRKIVKEKIQGETTVTSNHLIRFLIFGERKLALTVIRKDALQYTLLSMKQKVPKSSSLVRLLDSLSSTYGYETIKTRVIRKLILIQRHIRIFIRNRLARLRGPGFPVTRCVNDDCPYSLEALSDIPDDKIMTWREPFHGVPSKIYGCDVEMMIESLRRDIRNVHIRRLENPRTNLGDRMVGILNPFTREGLTVDVIRRCNEYTLLKKQTPLYGTPTHVRQTSRRNTSISHDLFQNPLSRRRNSRRGIGTRRLRNMVDSDDDIDDEVFMANERRTSFDDNPLLNINVVSPHLFERSHTRAIHKLESLIPIAEAVSEAFRDLEFYTQETMFTRPIIDMISLLRSTADGVSVDVLEDAVRYLVEHVCPLIQALTVGTNYAAITSVVSRISSNSNRAMTSTLRTRIRHVLRMFSMGNLEHMSMAVRNAVYSSRGRELLYVTHILSIADIVYRTMGGILLLAHPPLRDFIDLISEDDRKSFAIIFIGSFFEAEYLGDEFSWARFRE